MDITNDATNDITNTILSALTLSPGDTTSPIIYSQPQPVSLQKYSRLLCPTSQSINCSCPYDNKTTAIACHYTTRQIMTMFIVRHEQGEQSSFMIFPSYNKFAIYLAGVPVSDRCFHEVILGDHPQRFKIDLDFTNSDQVHGSSTRYAQIVADEMVKLIHTMYFYNISTLDQECNPHACIAFSKGSINGPLKFGFHITIGGEIFAANNHEVGEFTRRLVSILPESISRYIDLNTSKSLQNWRILGCHKHGRHDRTKQLLHPHNNVKHDAIITQYMASGSAVNMSSEGHNLIILKRDLPPQAHSILMIPVKTGNYSQEAPGDINSAAIQASCDALLTEKERAENSFSHIVTGKSINGRPGVLFINYRRISPGYCDRCGRIHDSDNTLYFIYKSPRFIYKHCRHAKKSKEFIPATGIKV